MTWKSLRHGQCELTTDLKTLLLVVVRLYAQPEHLQRVNTTNHSMANKKCRETRFTNANGYESKPDNAI